MMIDFNVFVNSQITKVSFEESTTINNLLLYLIDCKNLDKSRKFRLIYGGRQLSSHKTLSECKIEEGVTMHLVQTNKAENQLRQRNTREAQGVEFFRRLANSVANNSVNMQQEDRDDETSSDDENNEEQGGFDVFLQMGATADDVVAMRREFHRGAVRNRREMIRLEQEWLQRDSQMEDEDVQRGLAAEAQRLEASGGHNDLVFGMVLGFVFSLITLVFVQSAAMTRKMKFGIAIGIVGNMCVAAFTISSFFDE